MNDLLALPPAYFQTFFLIFVRVSAALFTMPVFNNRSVPSMAKVGLGLLLAFLLVPVQPAQLAPLPDQLFPYILAVASEILVWLVLGFVAIVVFTGLQMAGQMIGLQLGLNIAASLDPIGSGQQISYVDQFYTVLAAVLFLAINGHHSIILALAQSFNLVPVNHFVLTGAMSEALLSLTAGMFVISLRIALPLLVTLLLTDLAMLMLSRTMPQLNVFVVDQPIKILVGFGVVVVALPLILSVMRGSLESIPSEMLGLLRMVPAQ